MIGWQLPCRCTACCSPADSGSVAPRIEGPDECVLALLDEYWLGSCMALEFVAREGGFEISWQARRGWSCPITWLLAPLALVAVLGALGCEAG